jgi:hypothetical protein
VVKIALCTLWITAAGVLFAQTADDLETVLGARAVSYSQAARFVLDAAEILPENRDALTAGNSIRADNSISLGELSLLIMKSFGLKGGILYTLFPNPRYACRELVYLKIIQGRTDPGGTVDGWTFLHILDRTLAYRGESLD